MASYPEAELRRLEARLLRNGYNTAEKLWLRCQRKAFQGFDQLLFDFYSSHGRLPRFLEWVLRREIRSISDPMELMRRSSESLSANILHGILFDASGKSYLNAMLGSFVRNVINIRPFNYISILHECKLLVDSMLSLGSACPLSIRTALSILKVTVGKYHPEVTSFVPSVFFLHFICPAVMQPATYGLSNTRPDAESLGNLIIGCKILQCIANNSMEHASIASSGDAGKLLRKLVETSQEKLALFISEISEMSLSSSDSTSDLDDSQTHQRKEECIKALANYCFDHRISRILTAHLRSERPKPDLVPDASGRVALTSLLRAKGSPSRKRLGSDTGSSLSSSPTMSRPRAPSRESKSGSRSPMKRQKQSGPLDMLRERHAEDSVEDIKEIDEVPRPGSRPSKRSLGSFSRISSDSTRSQDNSNDSYNAIDDSRSEDRSEDSSVAADGEDDEFDLDDVRRHDAMIEEDDTAAVTIPPLTLKRVVRAVDGSMVSLEDILSQTKLTLVVLLRHFG